MADGNSLVNLGDLSKPATVFIEKISSAIGIAYEPFHVKRMARAGAEAEKIKALARIELTELEHRAVDRFVQQEARKQKNIEQITTQALASLPHDAKVEKLDEDWVAHFFKQCDTVSDTEMQSMWSRLLSGEATTPGTFSRRTVDFVSSMDKKDATLFTTFCQFVWLMGEPSPLIYETENEIYTKQGVNFAALKHLDSIGLISFESVSNYIKKGFGKHWRAFYYGQATDIEFSNNVNELQVGHVLLTSIGEQLFQICGSSRNRDFYEYVIHKWFQDSLILSTHVTQRP